MALAPIPRPSPHRLLRVIDPHPFVPAEAATLDERCHEVFQVQTAGLARRIEHVGVRRVVLGLSGGLDSTLALLVCARTFDLLGLPRQGILAVTLPGFGTTTRTLDSARRLAACYGAELREIDIRPACEQHIKDIGLDPKDRASTTYQNLQARERTQILMDLANKEAGLVVGTSDLSELALGFATFAGDQIAMYGVNCSVPKTLVKRLVEWVAAHHASAPERDVLKAVLETPVSPELVPPGKHGEVVQKTEELVGPYELVDFFLHAMLRHGAGPRKMLFLAAHAFASRYDEATLRKWLDLVPAPLLQPAVEALGDARRAEGRLGEPLAARRLAHAERRGRGRVAARDGAAGRAHDPRRAGGTRETWRRSSVVPCCFAATSSGSRPTTRTGYAGSRTRAASTWW